MKLLLLVAAALVRQAEPWTKDTDFCQYRCPRAGIMVPNIACSFYKCRPNKSKCTEIEDRKQEFRLAILDMHNSIRSRVATGEVTLGGEHLTISNMMAMNYDFDLEHMAKCLANKCTIGRRCMGTPAHRAIGSNVAYIYDFEMRSEASSKLVDVWIWLAEQWFEEKARNLVSRSMISAYGYESLEVYNDVSRVGNVLWGKTVNFGCARSKFRGPKFLPKYRLVCAYGPAVQHGKRMFKLGAPCSKCPMRVQCSEQYKGLCGEVVEPIYNAAVVVRTSAATILLSVIRLNMSL